MNSFLNCRPTKKLVSAETIQGNTVLLFLSVFLVVLEAERLFSLVSLTDEEEDEDDEEDLSFSMFTSIEIWATSTSGSGISGSGSGM